MWPEVKGMEDAVSRLFFLHPVSKTTLGSKLIFFLGFSAPRKMLPKPADSAKERIIEGL